MKKPTILLIILLFTLHSFGQVQDFDSINVSVLKTIRDNASPDSPLKTEWADESAIGSWTGIKWSNSTPKEVKELELIDKKLTACDCTKLNMLEKLTCTGNPKLTELKVAGLSNLKYLDCYSNGVYNNGNILTSLDLSGLINLETLYCQGNRLTSLEISELKNLRYLECNSNLLTSIDLSNLINLETVGCSSNQLVSIKLSRLQNLKYIDCSYNNLDSLDLKGLINLEFLLCGSNNLTSLDVSGLTKLQQLYCEYNKLLFSGLITTINLPFSWSTLGPQKQVFEFIRNAKVGDVIDLSSEAKVNEIGTIYNWYRNGKKIEGTDQSGKYRIEQSGSYYCTLTNSNFPGLTLKTYTLYLFTPVVDNSAWFPPARSQRFNDCTNFSLIYNLKSYLWNRHFNRDPQLPANQFSSYFVWNQFGHFGANESAFQVMKNMGCCSVNEFTMSPDSVDIFPSRKAKEVAMLFQSKDIQRFNINFPYDPKNVEEILNVLKDSLAKGQSFTLGIPNFFESWTWQGNDLVYDYSEEIDWASLRSSHQIAIVGYNDTIKTKYGKGAFKLINSNGTEWGNNGYGYIAYNWFFQNKWWFDVYFLEEKFNYQPDILLSLDINNTINGEDRFKYIFVDTLYDYGNRKIDFRGSDSYYDYPNTIKIQSINNQIISPSGFKDFNGPNSTTSINNRLFVPPHNHSGNYEILADLTEYLNDESFESCEILINDPISATFIGKNDQILYSYTREPKAEVSSVYIKSIKSSFIIEGKVTNMPDTTIILYDFDSSPYLLGSLLTPPVYNDFVSVKQSITKLKRKKITFNITDKQIIKIPIANAGSEQAINEGTTVFLDGSLSYDPDGNPLTYKWTAPVGITLNSTAVVKPTFTAPEVTQDTPYTFSLVVNDGIFDSPVDQVNILVKQVNKAPFANAGQDQSVYAFEKVTLNGFTSSDPDGSPLIYKWTAPIGITLSSKDKPNPTFIAPDVPQDTQYTFLLIVNDGQADSQADQVIITVKHVNKVPLANAGHDQIANEGDTINLNGSESTDPEGDPLTYKWTHITSKDIHNLPLGPEAFIRYGSNGLETKLIKAKEASKVFLTFSATDDKIHNFTFTDRDLEFIKVMFSKADGNKSIGFPAPILGSYEFVIDNTEKGTLLIESILSSPFSSTPYFIAPEVKRDSTFSFSLVVNDGIANSSPSTVKITVQNVIKDGVSTMESPYFNVYPNPTTGNITIEFTKNKREITELAILNMTGAQIYKKRISDKSTFQIDLSSQVNGVYMLIITNEDQHYCTKIILRKNSN